MADEKSEPRFDMAQLIKDCGGPAVLSAGIQCQRTQPYAWGRRRRVYSDTLAKIKRAFPFIDLNKYVA